MLFPFLTLDDASYIYENPNVRSGLSLANLAWAFTTLHANISYWHPITWLSHQLDSQLFGLQAGAHHLTNVILHSANSILVLVFARKLRLDRKSTRLNSSHRTISYAVFCLKKKKKKTKLQ